MITIQTVNQTGLSEIRDFLSKTHVLWDRAGFDSLVYIRTWAQEAEFQMSEGNPPTIEIRSWDSLTGKTETYTISEAGISTEIIDS